MVCARLGMGPLLAVLAALSACGEPTRSARSQKSPDPEVATAASPQGSAASIASSSPPPESAPKAELSSKWTQSLIYEKPRFDATPLGYFRAGSRITRAAEPVEPGPLVHQCPGRWYAIEPRGYVCDGQGGVTSDLDDPAVVAAARYAPKPEPLPFGYGMSHGTHMYARAPTVAQQHATEGDVKGYVSMIEAQRAKVAPEKLSPRTAVPVDGIPGFLEDNLRAPLLVPWPVPKDAVTAGYAIPATRLAFVAAFELSSEAGPRPFYLTTEHMVVPADRFKAARLAPFQGVELGDGREHLPMAWVRMPEPKALIYRIDGDKAVSTGMVLPLQSHVEIANDVTVRGVGRFYELRRLPAALADKAEDGARYVVRSVDATRVDAVQALPEKVAPDEVWVDVDLYRQVLVLYQGLTPKYTTLISSGAGGKKRSTPLGYFRVYAKHVTSRMSAEEKPPEEEGDEPEKAYRFDDVPYVQYLFKGIAFHAAFWHDGFGMPRSHGCINLSPRDAQWLFQNTLPQVPTGWHGINAGYGGVPMGTLVVIHG